MAIITFVEKDDNNEFKAIKLDFDGFAWEWICGNIKKGENFSVYAGEVCEENEISRNEEKMMIATDVTIVMLPAAFLAPFIPYIIAAVVAVAVVLLMPDIDVNAAQNQQAGSANNDLSNRRNKTRINERIVDFVGENLSIPDVIQPEFSFYDSEQKEVRVGAYAFCRNTCDVEDLSDGENLIADIIGAAAGIYRPYTSPNNSQPFQQIGEPINEPIVGVYSSSNAVGQTLEAPEVLTVEMAVGSTIFYTKSNDNASLYIPNFDTESVKVGSYITLIKVYADTAAGLVRLGVNDMPIVQIIDANTMLLYTGNNPEFGDIQSNVIYDIQQFSNPIIKAPELFLGDTYKIKREKVNRLLFNVYAPSGMYKRKSSDKEEASVSFEVAYYILDDEYNRIGARQVSKKTITGTTDDSIGETIDIKLGSASYVEWWIYRTSFEDVDYEGSVVDVIKLKSVFGLFDIDLPHFGNITMVQTKRKQVEQVTSVANPEVNAICTEMIYKYLGNGVFDTVLTKNTDAMQSLIAKALDPKIGRLTVDDLDLDLLLQTQIDNETYYQTDSAGKCSYSFDALNTSAQETFFLIANAASVILWREGRMLKSWFEKPQSVPEMIFTHRSKIIGDETWNRSFKLENDGVEFPYISDKTNSEETYTYPENAVNPKKIDYKGFRGEEQAIWRALREYYKLMNQRVTVDFTATAEGRFAKPAKLVGIVKGTQVGQAGGYVMSVNLLTVELSQEVKFTDGDDHFLVLKTRNGGTQTVSVTATGNPRFVVMDFAPIEEIYFGNDALKTEFSFANEERLKRQLMLVQTVDASERESTRITAVNYSDDYYLGDPISPVEMSYSDAYSNGYD